MSLDTLRLLEHVHGHLGWLAAALLVHPAIVLRDRRRRAHLAVALSTAAVTIGAGLGVFLYGHYRERLKADLYASAPDLGQLFERKEHLAFGAVLLAWAGASAYFGAPRASAAVRATLRTTAFRAFVAASVLALVVAAMGTRVAVHLTF
jgi:hypothetical protein